MKQSAALPRPFLPVIFLILAAAVAFYPVFEKLARLGWPRADYTHGYFIAPISLWLIYRKRAELKISGISPAAVAIFAAGLALYLFSRISEYVFLEAFSVVAVFWGIMALYFGASCRTVLFPLAYLLFMVPPPRVVSDGLTMPLKILAMKGSHALLKLAQLPVSVNGAILRVGEYDFFVSDACSGYRSMISLLALGSLYAYFQKTTTPKKWLIFLSVIPLGIAGNTLRIFITGCIGHFVGLKYAEGFFHEFSGAVVFLVAIFGLIFISDRLAGSDAKR